MSNTFIKDKVGETLLITLNAKCKQTREKDSFFSDPRACELMDSIDYDFAKFDKDKKSTVGVALRAGYFDRQVIEFVSRVADPVVVLVGCGLDTRYDRIGVSAHRAVVYQMDIPEVMDIREELLPPRDGERYIQSSILYTDWLDQIKAAHPDGDFLFIIEGVLMYFSEEEVRTVFDHIAERFERAELGFDIINKWMQRNSHRHGTVKLTGAKFKFGTNDDRFLQKWDSRYRHTDTQLFKDFKEWGQVGWLSKLVMSTVPIFKTSGRMVKYWLRPVEE